LNVEGRRKHEDQMTTQPLVVMELSGCWLVGELEEISLSLSLSLSLYIYIYIYMYNIYTLIHTYICIKCCRNSGNKCLFPPYIPSYLKFVLIVSFIS